MSSRLITIIVLLWVASSFVAVKAFSSTSRGRVFVSTPVKLPQRVVADCMANRPPTVSSSTTVDEAIAFLLDQGLTGAPVIDDGMLVGMLSSFDFLSKEAGGALLPMEGSKDVVENYAHAAQKIIAQKVEEIMTRDPLTISPTNSMREAASIMVQHKLHHLPVCDDKGGLVGILSSSDVMLDVHTVARMALPKAEEGESGSENPDLSP